jgi:rhodanese-related sulfurtransferase
MKALIGQAPPILIDIPEAPGYLQNHIPGAIRVNLESINGYAAKGNIPRDIRIVSVCAFSWDSQIETGESAKQYRPSGKPDVRAGECDTAPRSGRSPRRV